MIVLEITDNTHECCNQHCSVQGMPTLPCTWLTTGPFAVKGGTPGTIQRSISCAKDKPIIYAHYCVLWDVPWPKVVEAAGDVVVEFHTGYGVAAGSQWRYAHLCHLDNDTGCACQTPCLLGSTADLGQTLQSDTKYQATISNPSLPGGSGTDTLMVVYVFSGPGGTGYSIPFYYKDKLWLKKWCWRSQVSLGAMHRTPGEVLAG